MRFAKVRRASGGVEVVLIDDQDQAFPLDAARLPGAGTLADLLAADDPVAVAGPARYSDVPEPVAGLQLLAPVDRQEVWAAGVTYKRSKVAREEESVGAASFYDKVYTADRPELFLKSLPERVVGPGGDIRVRRDSKWSVPEPELALVIAPDLRIVGYTIGNDVSSRDIEGENPLYLPQAKVYDGACAVGPVITPVRDMPPLERVTIRLVIRRAGKVAFDGATSAAEMARTPEGLVGWLGRENTFPHGAVLLTGTGIVPPDDFSLAPGDAVDITVAGIGTLSNPVGP